MLIVLSFALGAIVAIATVDGLRWLIPVILLFVATGVVVLVWAVLRLAQKDPTPLVLGEMTGGDWLAHRRLVMGDDLRGDQIEIPSTETTAATPAAEDVEDVTIELPPAEEG